MAAEYEVNIKLNTQQIERELKKIESSVAGIGNAEKKSKTNADKRAAAMVRLRNVGDQIRKLQEQGAKFDKAGLQLKKAAEAIDKGNLATAKERTKIVEQEAKAQQKITNQLERQARRAGKAAVSGAQRQGRGRNRFQDIATGAGFPLLFGGGPLQAIAGGVGGAFGSLGGSIAATAAISQLQAFGQTAAEIGQAVSSTGGALDLMQEKALFSTKAIERQATALEEQGKVQELNALITQELADKIGNEGIRSLQELGNTTDETSRLWGELTTQLAALISGPLNGFLSIVNQVLGAVTGASRREAFLKDLGAQENAARARFKELTGESLGTGRSGAKARKEAQAAGRTFLSQEDALAQLRKEFQAVNPVSIPITTEDIKRFTPKKDTEAEKAAREEARIQKRLKNLEEEQKKIIEISRFKDKIANAEAARDEQLVIRLKGEQQIAEIEAKRKQSVIDITDQRLIDAINIEAATEKLATQRDTERELVELQRQKDQDRMDSMKKLIEQQYELNETVKQQLALADGIAQVMGKGMAESFDLLINGAKNWGAALKDIAANVLRDIARQLIQIYVIEQSIGFLRNFLTPFDPSTPLGAGGGRVGNFGTFGPNYGISQRQLGGPVGARQPYLVGERGPELFVPGAQGNIVPNNAMGGANIVVNVDASGSQAQGNEPNAKALGSAIGAAVQAELIKQKRPGGLLS